MSNKCNLSENCLGSGVLFRRNPINILQVSNKWIRLARNLLVNLENISLGACWPMFHEMGAANEPLT